MVVLGFDTSMAVTSAACVAGEVSYSTPLPPADRMRGSPQHSRELLTSLDLVLSGCGCFWADVSSIAVGIGPGTFTGLRIGISTARALGQALGVGLRPVSSLHALAVTMAAAARDRRSLVPLIDARRNQVFAALYANEPRGLRLEWGPVALASDQLLARLGEQESVLAAGDWALESRTALESVGIEVPPYESGAHVIDATRLCHLGLERPEIELTRVEPEYVRLPDAEINRRAKEGVAGDVDD